MIKFSYVKQALLMRKKAFSSEKAGELIERSIKSTKELVRKENKDKKKRR